MSSLRTAVKTAATALGFQGRFSRVLEQLQTILGNIHINDPIGYQRERLAAVRRELDTLGTRSNTNSMKKYYLLNKIYQGLVLLDEHEYKNMELFEATIRSDAMKRNRSNGDTVRMAKLLLGVTINKMREFVGSLKYINSVRSIALAPKPPTTTPMSPGIVSLERRLAALQNPTPRTNTTRKQRRSQRKTRKQRRN